MPRSPTLWSNELYLIRPGVDEHGRAVFRLFGVDGGDTGRFAYTLQRAQEIAERLSADRGTDDPRPDDHDDDDDDGQGEGFDFRELDEYVREFSAGWEPLAVHGDGSPGFYRHRLTRRHALVAGWTTADPIWSRKLEEALRRYSRYRGREIDLQIFVARNRFSRDALKVRTDAGLVLIDSRGVVVREGLSTSAGADLVDLVSSVFGLGIGHDGPQQQLLPLHPVARAGDVATMRGADSSLVSTGGSAVLVEGPSPEVVAARYQVIRTLGVGGFGKALLCQDRILRRRVVVKLLRDDRAADPDIRKAFLREALTMAALRHRNIVTIFDQIESPPGIVMEYCPGGSLKARIEDPEDRANLNVAGIGLQIAEALHEVHTAGAVHMDVGPHNIFLEADGTAKLGDFGVAKVSRKLAGTAYERYTVGRHPDFGARDFRGTPAYDVYSLGQTLVACFLGWPDSRPFVLGDVRRAKLMPREMQTLAQVMLSDEPEERPPARAVAETLRSLR